MRCFVCFCFLFQIVLFCFQPPICWARWIAVLILATTFFNLLADPGTESTSFQKTDLQSQPLKFSQTNYKSFSKVNWILFRLEFENYKLIWMHFLGVPHLATFPFYFLQFAYIPSSICHQDSNPRPFGCKSYPITARTRRSP